MSRNAAMRGSLYLLVCIPAGFGTRFRLSSNSCNYSMHVNTSFLGPNNVIACLDNEYQAHCQNRCDADKTCAGYGVYTVGSKKGRCCTKSNNHGQAPWPLGVSYTKIVSPACPFVPMPPPSPSPPEPVPPAPPSVPVSVSTIFHGNTSFFYNKGAMLEVVSEGQGQGQGQLAAAFQAGLHEAAGNQRIVFGFYDNKIQQWPSTWMTVTPPSPDNWAQWEPILFYAPNGTLWLFWSEGPGARPNLLYAQTTDNSSNFSLWSPKRLLLNASTIPTRAYLYPINRVVITHNGSWLVPTDYGCGGTGAATAAFAMISNDQGLTWFPGGAIPGIPTNGLCPEPAMAVYNETSVFAVVRSAGVGFYQSWSHDHGVTWSKAVNLTGIDGASAKPSLVSYGNESNRTLVLAYNVHDRHRMALSHSRDGGRSWHYFATLDNGTGHTTCYPTNIVDGEQLLTAWSLYYGGPSILSEVQPATILLGRTALP